MDVELISHNDRAFLEVKFTGVIESGEGPAVLPGAFEKARHLGKCHILLNMTNAVLNESLEDSFEVISSFPEYGLSDSHQLAIAFTQDTVQMHFLKTFASLKQIKNVAFFRTRKEALVWLLG